MTTAFKKLSVSFLTAALPIALLSGMSTWTAPAHAEEPAKSAPVAKTPTAPRAGDPGARYAWLVSGERGAQALTELKTIALEQRFAPPRGFTRVKLNNNPFGAFLRTLPLRTDRTTVYSHAGAALNSPAAAIVALDVGDRNLQQCADTIIRLHAEYLWSSDKQNELAYHFTSGDKSTWLDWAQGERFKVAGSRVDRVRSGKSDASRRAFRDWMDVVFMYAGTRSLRLDSKPVAPKDVRPGDFFVTPGSPGHAVIVLDVALHPDGRRAALLGQGFMPAQDLHVLRATYSGVLDQVWFLLPNDAQTLRTPSWQPFAADQIRRFHAK